MLAINEDSNLSTAKLLFLATMGGGGGGGGVVGYCTAAFLNIIVFLFIHLFNLATITKVLLVFILSYCS